ncbi:hypothetical protein [Gaetbulibacter jejuensis]|uniref:Uncharacterized protein n=1 Tax=Gaetbulibacter jejuensis TaxID=584607 RepID=A0ABP3V0H1_9FLAO|nr:hypothetical protein EVU94_06605 [Flavobacteriaceae bacterium 144Ye]
MKNLFLILFVLISSISIGQNNLDINRKYVSIKSLKNSKNINLKNAIYLENDTLVVEKSIPMGEFEVDFGDFDPEFIEHYKDAVFGNKETRRKNFKLSHVKLWTSDIKVYFDKSVDKKTKKELSSFFNEISKNSNSLKISVVSKLELSNYLIYYINSKKDKEHPNIIQQKPITYNLLHSNNKFYSGVLRLNTLSFFSFNDQINSLKVQFFKSLGQFWLINNVPCESILADCYSPTKRLTDLDFNILNFHYKNVYDSDVTIFNYERLIEKYSLLKKEHPTQTKFIID